MSPVNAQIQEMDAFRRALIELERKHDSMKNQYQAVEEEVLRLRREVEQRGGVVQMPHQMQHNQGPPPNIGHGHSNHFGGIISGGPGGPGLVAPPQMGDPSQQQQQQQSLQPPQQHGPPSQQQVQQPQQQPPHPQQAQHMQQGPPHQQPPHMPPPPSQQQQQQQYPYGGPNMPPGPGGPHSPYMNGGNVPQQGQPQPKRFKTEGEGPRYKTEGDIAPPGGPGSMYGNMSPNPHGNPSGPPPPGMSPAYNSPVPAPATSKQPPKSGKSGAYIQAKEEPQSGSVNNKRKIGASASTPNAIVRSSRGGNSQANWNDDADNVPSQLKREGSDWFAISNPKVPQQLKVDLVHTMEHSSADGKYLATGCNRSAQIYDIQSGQSVCLLADDSAGRDDLYIRSVCFSPDGKFLATGAEDKQIRIWDISRKRILKILKGHEQDIYSLDFSRDGRIIVSGSGDQTARIWDMETGTCLHKLEVGEVDQKDAGVTSVAISPDGHYVAAGSLDRLVRVWDTVSGVLLERLEGHKDSVYSVAFAPDGKTLVSGSLDRTLKSWELNLSRGQNGASRGSVCKATFNGHKDFVLSVAVSPDGKWVVSGSKDRGVQFWDPSTTAVQFMLQGHKNSVISVALSPMGTYFATGSGDTRALLLERLSLDHRTSLAEKACGYLQAVESNGSIKNHSSHAAICVDIAADQLSIEVSRQALVRLSGAASPSAYSVTLQTLSRILTGSKNRGSDRLGSGASTGSFNRGTHTAEAQSSGEQNEDDSSPHAYLRRLLTERSMTYLGQLSVQYGSLELEDIVLQCLEKFFAIWVPTLTPAQRAHVNYTSAKWVGAAFWLCALARNMTATKEADPATGADASSESKQPVKTVKRIGGRGAKELKDIILTTVEHSIKKTDLEATIRLVEDSTKDYLSSLKKSKMTGTGSGARPATSRRPGTPTTPRSRVSSTSSEISNPANVVIPMRGGATPYQSPQTPQDKTMEDNEEGTTQRRAGRSVVERQASLKRHISNVSQMSISSDVEDDGDGDSMTGMKGNKGRGRVSAKRTRLDVENADEAHHGEGMLSTDIIKSKRPKRGLSEVTGAARNAMLKASTRSRTGVYSMIPRVSYVNTKAYAQYKEWQAKMLEAIATAGQQHQGYDSSHSFSTFGMTHWVLWALAEEYIDQALSLCFIAITQPNSQPGWKTRHRDLILTAIKCLVASTTLESPAMTQLDKAKSRYRLAQVLFEETESFDRAEEEVSKAIITVDGIQGSTALDLQLRLYDLQTRIYLETGKFRLAKNTLRIATSRAEKARVCFMLNDLEGSLATLNQGAALAETRGDFELEMAFWIVAGQYSLMFANWDQAEHYLQKLLPHMGLDQLQNGVSSTAHPSLSLSASIPARVYEAPPKNLEEAQGIFRVPLNISSTSEQTGETVTGDLHILPVDKPSDYISIKWISFSQVYCLTYLLSGVCSKADMTQPMRSQQFLVEGIKVVDREFSVNEYAFSTSSVRRNQRWFSLLMMTMLSHLTDVFLIKFDAKSAEDTILKATYWAKVCGFWEMFKWRISLSIGMIMQVGGQLDEAIEWYEICMSHEAQPREDPEGYDAKSLAIVNLIIIYCGEAHHDLQKARRLLVEAKKRWSSSMPTDYQSVLHMLDGWTKESIIPASSLQNTQMKNLTLLLLGNIYKQTNDVHSEKILQTGYVHAFKTSSPVIAAAAGSCLKDLYLETSQGIKASQQAQQNRPILEAVDLAFQTKPMIPLCRPLEDQMRVE
ncbi:general transcription repressor [Lunasporangiospora selenospora]|uniref:General transcription repressor n=1 Tax=Lunasporangiospora selenospora TaxID=979761 RepID=A0A9P6G476_9FUNG|nr:general transcription repressor [Lunasporangiospora selenospora]